MKNSFKLIVPSSKTKSKVRISYDTKNPQKIKEGYYSYKGFTIRYFTDTGTYTWTDCGFKSNWMISIDMSCDAAPNNYYDTDEMAKDLRGAKAMIDNKFWLVRVFAQINDLVYWVRIRCTNTLANKGHDNICPHCKELHVQKKS